jgi:hypothetical protein
MRQVQQQKNRMRGRGRKMPNPMNRSFESNGPDVKIRGNAAHIAEKYASLARDAFSAGDPVLGENYLQHAEHYNRIVAASQPQRPDDGPPQPFDRGPQPDMQGYEGGEDDGGDEQPAADFGIEAQPPVQSGGAAGERAPGQGYSQGGAEGGDFQQRHHRNRRRFRPGDNGNRDGGNRDGNYRDYANRDNPQRERQFRERDGREGGNGDMQFREPDRREEPRREEPRREEPRREEQRREAPREPNGGDGGRSGVSSDASMLPQSLFGGSFSAPKPATQGRDEE